MVDDGVGTQGAGEASDIGEVALGIGVDAALAGTCGRLARSLEGALAKRHKPSQSTIKRLLIDFGVKRLASLVLVSGTAGAVFEPVDMLPSLESLVWASDIVEKMYSSERGRKACERRPELNYAEGQPEETA
jgi:hypothetical protein